MAVTLVSTGGLFKRLGLLFGKAANIQAMKGAAATTPVTSAASLQTFATNLEAYASESPAVSAVTGDQWAAVRSWEGQQSGFLDWLKTEGEGITKYQVNLDYTLPSYDLTSALVELIRQMNASSDSINASSVALGAQTSLGSPVGNPTLVLSAKRYDGLTWPCVVPETLRFSVTADSYTGGATARRETVSVKGAAASASVWDRLWPAGSGTNTTLTLVDAQIDSTAGNNLLRGGRFEVFSTSNYPDNFTIGSGAAGTDFFAAGSGYTLSNALKVQGGGVSGPLIYQQFNRTASTTAGAGGSSIVLQPLKQYGGCFFAKKVVATAGVLRVALVDSAGTVLNDEAGNAQSTTYTLSGWTTSYVAKTFVFRTPAILPADGIVRLEFKLTTNLTDATESVIIDDLAMAEMVPLYIGGPSAAMFAGSTKVKLNDSWTSAVTNTMGAVASWLERFFALNSKNLIFPSSGSPTVADSVIA
jgi:hypothetical protein